MTWSVCRWTWLIESPLFVGTPPAGPLNRCRLYVPARALWGALTAELARQQAHSFPEYAETGYNLRDQTRLTYLYPAEKTGNEWRAWLPRYVTERGLIWQREDRMKHVDGSLSARGFRQRILDTRPATAIDPNSDTAEDRSIRETECVQTRWRNGDGPPERQVALVGYLVYQAREWLDSLTTLDTLFLGGDTRYGLGKIRRIESKDSHNIFGSPVDLDEEQPIVRAETVLAHALAPQRDVMMVGAKEALAIWDSTDSAGNRFRRLNDGSLWEPGSTIQDEEVRWRLNPHGLWELHEASTSI